MSYIKINHSLVTPENAAALMKLCPFSALEYADGRLSLNAGCKNCGICAKRGPAGVMELIREETVRRDFSDYGGFLVYCEQTKGAKFPAHPVAYELIGKAKALADGKQPVMALLFGYDTASAAESLIGAGADYVYVCDKPELEYFRLDVYARLFAEFIRTYKPASVLVGATDNGRSLAPRVAASLGTGLTADCTALELDGENLAQIRPAFGGNIMARIKTPNHRPQFATVRYKIFPTPAFTHTGGKIVAYNPTCPLDSVYEIHHIMKKPAALDISEAEYVVACGRGLKSRADLMLVERLAGRIGAVVACTRPLAEAGWLDQKRQIGLSGRTVKPKLIITCGVSGSVQFAAGMKGADRIVAINTDRDAPIFSVADVGLVGDLYEILPRVIKNIEEGAQL